jgi:hypothetical protein
LRDGFSRRPVATDHQSLRRLHLFAARFAIIAMLIDALLPSAVSAAANPGSGAPLLPLCRAALGAPLPRKEAPPRPARHCSLCAVSSTCVVGLLPSRTGGGTANRLPAGAAHSAILPSVVTIGCPADDGPVQPRAPPSAFS